jgi:DNA-binding MarR family transcriptional regulator
MASVITRPRRAPVVLPFESSIGYQVRITNRAFQRALQARIEPNGITWGMWWFLRVLWHEDGLTQRQLSQRVGMMEATTVTALNNMEKVGLIRRVRNTEDRRKTNVFLTEHGRDLRDALLPLAAEVNAVGLDGLSKPEVSLLLGLLARVRVQLEASLVNDPDAP